MNRLRQLLAGVSAALNRVFPTSRLAVVLMVTAVALALTPLWRPSLALAVALDGVLLALCLVDYRLLRGADHLTAARRREQVFSLGVSNPVRLTVRNRGDCWLQVTIADEFPHEFSASRETFACALPPEGEWRDSYDLTPLKRGDYQFGRLVLRTRTRLGLLQRQQAFEFAPKVQVYPNLQDVRKHELLGRQNRLGQMGLRRLRLKGRSLEFDSLRDYVPGDELRRVHWKASARRGKLVTKEYDLERSQQVVIALDLGRTMASRLGDVTKLDQALNAALLVTHVASESGDHVGVLAFADEILGYLPPGNSRTQTGRVADFLYPLEASAVESDYRGAMLYLGQRCRRRSLLIVLTDLLDSESSAQLIRHLPPLTRRHLVLCVALSDYELDEVVREAPQQPRALFEQAVAHTLQHERALSLAALGTGGVLTMDAGPTDLSIAVVNRYLALKEEALL